jgi:NOL1/NOP2/fmu family ribosome biogenesis protein
MKSGKERVMAFSGAFSKDELLSLWKLLPIEGVGLYLGKEFIDNHGRRETRLSIDALHVLKEQITKNVIKLSEEQEEEWFKGRNVELNDIQKEQIKKENIKDFVAVKSFKDEDFIGTGKVSQDASLLFGFLPKERRVKN